MRYLVTGGSGLVGTAIKQIVKETDNSHEFVFLEGRNKVDLTDGQVVKELIFDLKPHVIIHAAARVGGIGGNMAGHANYFRDNILMNTHVIDYAHKANVQKLIAFTSVCVFPNNIGLLTENNIHQGEPFEGNFAYAYAKRMVDVQIRAYFEQFRRSNYCSVIPGNIFGENDNYNLEEAHVVPALIHKIFLAKKNNTSLKVWGDGSALREFLYAKDVARAVLQLTTKEKLPFRLLMSGKKEYSIRQLVYALCKVADFPTQKVLWDSSKPNGQNCRPSNLSALHSLLGDIETVSLEEGLSKSYKWFEENYPNVRK